MIEKRTFQTSTLIGAVVAAFIAGILAGVFFNNHKTGINLSIKPDSASGKNISSDISNQIADHEKAVAVNPDNIEAWIHLGDLYFDSGLSEKSVAAYEKALVLNPANADVWTDMGVMYRKTGKFEKAIECFDKAVNINHKHEVSRFNKGIVLMYDLNNKQEAIRTWEGLLDVNPFAMAPDGLSVDLMLKQLKHP
jgi:tetratricopeptide (TPR) repeat protein